MKKLLVLITALAVACMGTFVYANGIAQSSHFTAKHIAGMNDNTGDETAMYDPASTVWLKDGIYINVSSFAVIDNIEAKASGETSKGDVIAWTVPAVSALYKQGEIAGFLYLNILDGAPFASIQWDDGTLSTAEENDLLWTTISTYGAGYGLPASNATTNKVEASSVTYNVTLGGAYKINDMFSVSLAGRYITSKTKTKLDGNATAGVAGDYKLTLEYEEEADGFGGVIGFNVVPAHGWLIGLTYATPVKREFKKDVTKTKVTGTNPEVATGYSKILAGIGDTLDGKKRNYDMPGMVTLTAAGMPVLGTIIALQVNYMLNKQADWEDAEDDYDNTIVYMLALTQFLNQQLRFSLGLMYADKGTKDDYVNPSAVDVNPQSDEIGLGLCGAYSIDENLNVALTYSYTYYTEIKYEVEKLNKDRHVVGIQVGYKM